LCKDAENRERIGNTVAQARPPFLASVIRIDRNFSHGEAGVLGLRDDLETEKIVIRISFEGNSFQKFFRIHAETLMHVVAWYPKPPLGDQVHNGNRNIFPTVHPAFKRLTCLIESVAENERRALFDLPECRLYGGGFIFAVGMNVDNHIRSFLKSDRESALEVPSISEILLVPIRFDAERAGTFECPVAGSIVDEDDRIEQVRGKRLVEFFERMDRFIGNHDEGDILFHVLSSNATMRRMDDANREKCPLCGSPTAHACTSTDYISDERFSIVACPSCGLGQTLPRVPATDLSKYYMQGYYKKRKSGADEYINRARLKRVSSMAAGTGKRMLDVGSGNGALVEKFGHAGWDARGIEMAPPEHFVSSEVQKKIFIGDVLEAPFEPHSFDVITLFHVLEHLTEPKASLAKIHTLLRENGLLVIEVPNRASWQARLTGGTWFNLDVPRHVFHFTPRSLTMLLEQSGFRVEHISHYSRIYSLYGLAQSILNMMTQRGNILFDMLNGKLSFTNRAAQGVKVSDMLLTILFAVPATLIAVPLTILESLFKQGGIITVYAHPVRSFASNGARPN